MPSVQQEEGHALLKSTHIRPAALLLSISKSNWFYFKSDQCSFDPGLKALNRTAIHTAGYTQKGTSTLSHRQASQSSWIESEEPKLDDNKKIGECRKIVLSVLTRTTLKNLRGILHAQQSEMQTFETIRIFLQFLFAAITLPLNNNICLSVCFFRMLSDNPVEIIGSDTFTVPGNDLLVQVLDVL